MCITIFKTIMIHSDVCLQDNLRGRNLLKQEPRQMTVNVQVPIDY